MSKHHSIHIKHFLQEDEVNAIKDLETRCLSFEPISLKLELDYKLASGKDLPSSLQSYPNEFLYYIGQTLVGYLGICHFGSINEPLEICGMVHPDYRRQGIFKHLFKLAITESKSRPASKILLLCDPHSNAGLAFICQTNAQYAFSEYEMSLDPLNFPPQKHHHPPSISLKAATDQDVHDLAIQNAIYFGEENEQVSESNYVYPETEAKKGLYIFFICLNDKPIGKINLEYDQSIGGIYGFGILPEHRRNGYGRAGLLCGIQYLIDQKVQKIHLQVESQNSHALELYTSCGFQTQSVMTYSEFRLSDDAYNPIL